MSKKDRIKELITKGSKKLDWFFYAGVLMGILFGPVVLVSSFIPSVKEMVVANGANELLYMRIFGGFFTFMMPIVLIEQYNKKKGDNSLIKSLEDGFDDVVWVYKEVSTAKYSQVASSSSGATVARYYHAHFKFVNGKDVLIWLSEKEVDQLIALIRDEYKNISLGYNEDLLKLFKKDPTELKINPKRVESVRKRTARNVRT
jgi:hypothetical protein